jgi:hypothetical protein
MEKFNAHDKSTAFLKQLVKDWDSMDRSELALDEALVFGSLIKRARRELEHRFEWV